MMDNTELTSEPNTNWNSTEKISKKGMRIFFGVQVVILVIVFLCLLDLGTYGWTLFCVIPFSLGITAGVYTQTYKSKKILRGFFWVLFILSAVCGLLLFAGVEGVICVLMAAGLVALPTLAGMLVGYFIRNAHKIYGLALILLLNTSAYVYDKNDSEKIESITSEDVVVNASKEKIWDVLTHPVNYSNHENFFFKAGVSYPTSMEISRKEGNCFLACKLNNGFTNLPIAALDTLKRLRFTMPEHVIPMKELTPYDSIHAEHLEGYFLPAYGEFKIEPITKDQCRLIAETAYSYKITPVFYWRWWSDYLVNTMHKHVLSDIKKLSEQPQ